MSTLTVAALASMAAQETDEVWLMLLELSGSTMASPIYLVNNTENITHQGNVYVAAHFEIGLLQQSDTELPRVTVRIPNVDLQIIGELRALGESPDVLLTVIIASEPDIAQYGPITMGFRDANYDEVMIEGNLATDNLLAEPCSSYSMTPTWFPGLF